MRGFSSDVVDFSPSNSNHSTISPTTSISTTTNKITTTSPDSNNGLYKADGFNLEWQDNGNSTEFNIKTTIDNTQRKFESTWFGFGLSTDQLMVRIV
jgi:hypothetical protein